jgi:hypothetical protein
MSLGVVWISCEEFGDGLKRATGCMLWIEFGVCINAHVCYALAILRLGDADLGMGIKGGTLDKGSNLCASAIFHTTKP